MQKCGSNPLGTRLGKVHSSIIKIILSILTKYFYNRNKYSGRYNRWFSYTLGSMDI